MLLLFVHRIESLPQGLYALCRDPSRLTWLTGCAPRYSWQPVMSLHKEGVPLYVLEAPQDVIEAAKALSCQQDIVTRGCVTFAFLVEFVPLLSEFGAWMYKR